MPTYGPWNTKDVLEDKLKELDWRKQVPSPKPPQAQPPTPLAAPSPTPQPFGAQPQPYRPITPATAPPRDTKAFEAALKPQPNRVSWPAAVEAEFTRSPGAFASNYPALSRRKGKVGWPTGSTPENPKPHPLSVEEAERAFAMDDANISQQPLMRTLTLANRPLQAAGAALNVGAGAAESLVPPNYRTPEMQQRIGLAGKSLADPRQAIGEYEKLPMTTQMVSEALVPGQGIVPFKASGAKALSSEALARARQTLQTPKAYARTALETTGPALGIPKQELRTAGMAAKKKPPAPSVAPAAKSPTEAAPVPQGPPQPRPAPDVTVPPVEAPKAARTPEEIAAWQKGLEAPAQPEAPPLRENAAAWRPPVGEAERPAVAGALPKGTTSIEAPPAGYKRGELAVVGPGTSPVDDPLYAALKAAVEGTPPAGTKPPVVEGATPAQPQKPAGFKYAGDMRPIEDVVKEVVTSDNPFVRALAGYTGINPSVLQNTEAGRALTAYYRQMVASQELTEVAIGASLDTHAQRFTGARGLNIDNNGFMKGTGKQWNDVFSRYQDYNLKPELKAYVEDYLRVVDEVEALRIANGLKPMPKRSAEGWFYVPRQVKTIRGVELRKPSSSKLQRLHEEATAGYARGVRYEADPRAVLELHVRNAYREIAEKQLSDLLEPLSIKPSQLVPEPVRIRMEQAIKNRMAAERAARKLIQGEAKEGGRVPMPSTFASKVAVDPQVMAARMQYQVAKNAYTRALEAARKAEVAPGKLFGRTEETIGIGNWRNRFYPREMYDQLVKGTEQFGKLSPETHPWLRGVEILGNHIRFLSSVGDFAAPMVQGLPLLARHPAGWARATARHYQAFLDPTVQARLLRDNLETFQWMARNGVPVGDPEFFAALKEGQGISAGKLLTYAPGGEEVRRVLQQGGRQSFGRFQSSYNTFLGYGRAQIVKAMRESWKGTDDELAAYIRNMTGGLDTRALGVQPSQRAIESVWLAFSPRLLRSTTALVGDAMRPNTVRGRAALRSLATLASGVAALYIASGLAMGRDWDEITEGLNPLNGKKFLSYQVNGDWIGVGGQIRAITQLLASGISALAPGGKPAGVLASPDRYDNPIVNFYMGRGAPAVNIVGGMVEAASGGNIDALPFAQVDGAPDLVKHLGTSALPFVAQGVVEGQQPLTSATGMVGMRTSAPTAGEKITRMAEQAGATVSPSGEVGQKGYSQAAMTPEGRAAIRKSGQDLRKWEDRWKYYDAQLERDSDLERSWTVTNQGAKQPYGGKDWVDDYYKAQAEQAATRAVTSKPFTAKTPEAKALADYYAIADQFFNPRTRTFDSAGYQEALDSYLASLGPEMAEYVEGQLHPYETPEVARYNEGRKQYRAYLGVLGKWIESNYPEYLEQWETYVAQGKPSTSSVLLRNLSSIEDKLRKQMRIDNPELEDWLLRYGYVTVPISESLSRTLTPRATGSVGQPVRGATGVKGITGTSR